MEARSLIAYALDAGGYRVIASRQCQAAAACNELRIPPFEAVQIDLAYVFGREPRA
jgi:hypothetical protein